MILAYNLVIKNNNVKAFFIRLNTLRRDITKHGMFSTKKQTFNALRVVLEKFRN